MPPPSWRVTQPRSTPPTTSGAPASRMASAMRARLLATAASAAAGRTGPAHAGGGSTARTAGLASRATAPEVATSTRTADAAAAAAAAADSSSAPAAASTRGAARGRSRAAASAGPPTRLVIVESPAKAKKISGYLGPGSTVLATYGHVRDLPARAGSVEPDAGFAMAWEAAPKARAAVAAIAAAAARATEVVLATDPDREGEAISWHILEELKDRGALRAGVPVHRATFTSVTKPAVLAALAAPRPLAQPLVRAYFARRALDYLYGFSLSPLLWRKLPAARSAGRVQSAALRLVAQREAEVRAFSPTPYWSVDAVVEVPDPAGRGPPARVSARLTAVGGDRVAKPGLADADVAEAAAAALRAAGGATVASAATRPSKRSPPPPLATAGLQTAAAALLGLSPSDTMAAAQALYEGSDAAGGEALITYMRTDGLFMPPDAVDEVRAAAAAAYGGQGALSPAPRSWAAKTAKNAQEAHEAIRPVDPGGRPPGRLPPGMAPAAARVYELVWRRTLASQMADAALETAAVEFTVTPPPGQPPLTLRATATRVVDPGFTAAFSASLFKKGGAAAAAASKNKGEEGGGAAEGDDAAAAGAGLAEPSREEAVAAAVLARLQPGATVALAAATAHRHETRPPPRYTEATLVAALEAAGVGRPSTYAPTVRLLQARGYVGRAPGGGRRLVAEPRGRVLAAYLDAYFQRYVEASYTATMEDRLDDVAAGRAAWTDVLADFWSPLAADVAGAAGTAVTDIVDAVDARLGAAVLGVDRACPACGSGRLGVKLSAAGGFVGCSRYPACGYSRPLHPEEAEAGGEGGRGAGSDGATPAARPSTDAARLLGADPDTGLPITVRRGPYGHYIQVGPAPVEGGGGGGAAPEPKAGKAKRKKAAPPPRRASLPKGADAAALTLHDALALLAFPRDLGAHPADGGTVEVARGPYGFYVRHWPPGQGPPPAGGSSGKRGKGAAAAAPKPPSAQVPPDMDPAALDLHTAVKLIDDRYAAMGEAGRRRRGVGGGGRAAVVALPPPPPPATKEKAAAAAAPTPPAASKPPSAYLAFCAEQRPAVVDALGPGARPADVMKELAARWRAAKEEAAGGGVVPAAAPARQAKATTAPPAEKKRRAPSAYIVFCAAERPSVVADMGGSPAPAAVMAELGARWRALGEGGQAEWKARAARGGG